MLSFLFPGLTADPQRGARLFEAVNASARKAHWYVAGAVPDTIDGRFRVLATLAAVLLVRLESAGEAGNAASVTFTERFVEVMESEHREIGLGDPTLGKTVRRLVALLAKRVELWRSAALDETAWQAAAMQSLYKGDPPEEAVQHSAAELQAWWRSLTEAEDAAVIAGKWA